MHTSGSVLQPILEEDKFDCHCINKHLHVPQHRDFNYCRDHSLSPLHLQ